ncbi:hypothetical protein [Methylobacterium frigidaeris]|nr:hypothetical protein [Methylobacterium frigidaeris]
MTTMIVTPYPGRTGEPVATHEGVLLLFDRRAMPPPLNSPVEVMILKAPGLRYHSDYAAMTPEEQERNPPRFPFLFVRPVTDDDALVEHDGFECSGSMCRTSANLTAASDHLLATRYGIGLGWITPGRTPVLSVSNVNTRWPETPRPLVPGKAYLAGADVRQGLSRITGVPDLDQLDPAVVNRLTRIRAWREQQNPPQTRRTVDTLTSRRGQRSA